MALVTLDRVRTPAHRGQSFECDFWQLEAGQKWFVVGANGSGKTTMAQVITGKQVISRGEVRLAEAMQSGQELALVSFEEQQKLHAHDDRFDDSELREDANDPGTIVAEFLGRQDCELPLYKQWLTELGLESIEGRGIRRLSTGEMRKVLLAKAVLIGARVLILDDPLAGLDAQTQGRFSQLLDTVFAKLDTVLVLSTNLQDLSSRYTHIATLVDGKVTLAGAITEEMLRNVALTLNEAESLNRRRLPPQEQLGSMWPAMLQTDHDPVNVFIDMHKVSVSFGNRRIFSDLDWCMRRGDHAMIMGPNGCGKSTLLGMLMGENPKAYGQNISLFGARKGSGESIWELRKHFGLVSTSLQQKYAKGYRVLEVVLSGFQDSVGLYDDVGGQQNEIAHRWLSIVGAEQLTQRKFDSLSYGQQKLVLIARAMVKQPTLLVLDEPCIGLDQVNRERVLQLVDGIAGNSKTHLLFVSHVSDERPRCINQQLQFVWSDTEHCYRIDVSRT